MVGEYDLTLGFEGMTDLVANLHQTIILPGCGHWTQQERADQMSAAMIEFLVARTPLHPTVI
jgi:pimeloyl-ACP methyl ester carboxylesterase